MFRLNGAALRFHVQTSNTILPKVGHAPSTSRIRLHRARLTLVALRRPYATVHASPHDDIWSKHEQAPVQQSPEVLPRLETIVEAARAALDVHSTASEDEKWAVLEVLQNRVVNAPINQHERRLLRKRLTDAVTQAEPLKAIQQAVKDATSSPKNSGMVSTNLDPAPTVLDPGETSNLGEVEKWADLIVFETGREKANAPVLRDAEYIRTHMPLPTKEAYPDAPHAVLGLRSTAEPLLTIWQKHLRKDIDIDDFVRFSYKDKSELPPSIATRLQPGNQACRITARMPGNVRLHAVAVGRCKSSAKVAARLHIMSKLHSSGTLKKIIDAFGPARNPPSPKAESVHDSTSAGLETALERTTTVSADLPTQEEYPTAPATLFSVTSWRQAVYEQCQKLGLTSQSKHQEVRAVGSNNAYRLEYTIPDIFSEIVLGTGEKPKASAWYQMWSKLHTSGALHQIFTTSPIVSPQAAESSTWSPEPEELEMPMQKQYPHAPEQLFDSVKTSVAIDDACSKHGLSLEVDGHVHLENNSKIRYELIVDIAGLFKAHANGHGKTKIKAKKAAWKQAIAKLHASGALHKLFPDPDSPTEGVNQQGAEQEQPDYEDLVNLDEKTLENEKDSKVEIYNYAATFGLIPQFDVKVVTAKGRKRRGQKQAKSLSGVQVSIQLPELGIAVSRTGKTLPSAEAAAALEFKQVAEQNHESNIKLPGMKTTFASSPLTVETAPQFFQFYRSARNQLKTELEQEYVQVAGQGQNSAKLVVEDRVAGPAVFMRTKKLAEGVALLVAALGVVRGDHKLLESFAEALQKGKGKIFREVKPIDVTVDTMTLHTIRDTLVDVRKAGLPDSREALAPEPYRPQETKSRRTGITVEDRHRASKRLSEHHDAIDLSSKSDEVRKSRASLPMTEYRHQVLDLVSNNIYSIVVGATGSGKTTQVPQILLDDAIGRGVGGFCDVVCTQPRRLAASSIAARVAIERYESLQQSVGYHVRFDARLPQQGGSITYCTTGILLEQLKHDADSVLGSVSHLVIDEVHERDLKTDFLLNILRKAIRARQDTGKQVPKVILMSATLDEKLFSQYFGQDQDGKLVACPTLKVPGRTFPVQEIYLADILSELERSYGKDYNRLLELDSPMSRDYIASEMEFSGAAAVRTSNKPIDWKQKKNADMESGSQAVAEEKEEALVPLSLLASTIAHVCKTSQDGAILAFVPGLQEITSTRNILLQQPLLGIDFNDSDKFKICLLHSAIPAEEQRDVLNLVPKGCRKIILSTNIAETSVTVPDVKYVLDTGKLREKRYDQIRRITKLQCTWVSNSNARQRAGRAGRVQEGHYYALYTHERRQSLPTSGLPELLRSDLQETCLSVKAQGFQETIEDFLSQSLEPPPAEAVNIAISNLQGMDAFTETQSLTSLGRILSNLPVHPLLGKMILLGITFRCLEPMLILSSMNSERSLFITPVGSKELSRKAHTKYGEENSDHLAQLNAFNDLRERMTRFGVTGAATYADKNFLHMGAFRSIASTAEQIERILIDAGLVSRGAQSSMYGGTAVNQHSDNTDLIKCLLLAGVYPNLGVKTPGKSKLHRTPTEQTVLMHPGSHNFKRAYPSTNEEESLFAYSMLARSVDGNTLFMRDSTLVTPIMALLFGGKLRTQNWRTLEMDEWLPFRIRASGDNEHATQLILEFRKALDRMLLSAFESLPNEHNKASVADNPISERFVRGIVALLELSTWQPEIWVPTSWNQSRRSLAADSQRRFGVTA